VARSGQNINGGTSSLTLPAGSATAPTGAHVVSDGTNYEAALWGASSSGSGTVNAGVSGHCAIYLSSTAAVSSDPNCDSGVTTANVRTFAETGGIAAASFNSTDTVHNSSYTFITGSGGDSSCPTPVSGTSFICTKSSGISVSLNGGAYSPIMDAALALQAANNLSELASASTARTNLGLGAMATAAGPTFPPNAQTATYQVLAADFAACKTITVASGTFTVTLVASGSQPAAGQCIDLINYGSGVVTVTRSGQNINGGTASLSLPAGSATAPTGAHIVSDGTNYFGVVWGNGSAGGLLAANNLSDVSSASTSRTNLGLGAMATASGPNFPVNAQTATYQVLAADFSACKTITVASGTFTITLVASGSQPTNGACIDVINYGTGVVTIARSGQNINGGTSSLTLPAGSATAPTGAHVVSDGTNYEAAIWGGSSGTITAANGGTGQNTSSSSGMPKISSGTWSVIDFPERLFVPAANCVNAVPGSGWSIGSGGTVSCRLGTNNTGGYVAITDTSTTFAQFQVTIPEDWDTGADPYIRFQLAYPGTDGSSSHTIIPQIKVSCAKGDGSTSDDVTFSAAHSSSTITLSSATANLFLVGSNVQMNSTDMTGCVAGSMMTIQVGRATDTATSAANFYGATITFPRLLTVQAN
jgi:hypothetical protein